MPPIEPPNHPSLTLPRHEPAAGLRGRARIGAIHTFAIAGVLCIASALVFASALPRLRRISRPLYVRLGLVDG